MRYSNANATERVLFLLVCPTLGLDSEQCLHVMLTALLFPGDQQVKSEGSWGSVIAGDEKTRQVFQTSTEGSPASFHLLLLKRECEAGLGLLTPGLCLMGGVGAVTLRGRDGVTLHSGSISIPYSYGRAENIQRSPETKQKKKVLLSSFCVAECSPRT